MASRRKIRSDPRWPFFLYSVHRWRGADRSSLLGLDSVENAEDSLDYDAKHRNPSYQALLLVANGETGREVFVVRERVNGAETIGPLAPASSPVSASGGTGFPGFWDVLSAGCSIESGIGIKDGRGYGPYGMGYYRDTWGRVFPIGPDGRPLPPEYDFQPGAGGSYIPLRPPRRWLTAPIHLRSNPRSSAFNASRRPTSW